MSSIAATPSAPTGPSTDRLFWLTLAGTLAIKLVGAALTPLTGDEAYFSVWGRFPNYGYYDHGAMTGWWLWPALLAGNSVFLLRLPGLFTAVLGALLLRGILRPVDATKANLAAALFLLSPVNLLNVFFTTDTPLVFFSLLAGVFAVRAVRRDRLGDWVLAGLFLGFAFLAKYFAVLLGLAFAVYLLGFGGRRRFTGILAVLLGAVPGVAVNVAWNINHGWTNVLFNVYTRNAEARFSLLGPLILGAIGAIVLAGPVVLAFLLRRRCEGRRSWREAWEEMGVAGTRVAFFAVVVPVAVFMAVSLGRSVGLHWLLSFFPFFFLVLAAKFDAAALQRQFRPTLRYALGCTALGALLLALPVEWIRWHRSYNSIVLGMHPAEVVARIAPYAADYTITSPSYTKSGQLSFHLGRHVPVFGPGSQHGRQDDFLTDFRSLDGRNLLVFSPQSEKAINLATLFDRIETRDIEVRGARIPVVLGHGFKFAVYRETVLRPVAERYYRMPAWLAAHAQPGPFITRYGLQSAVAP